jgi:hypothetical protein
MTCDQPIGRAIRLDGDLRLVDVEPGGQLGLAWDGSELRMVDLRRLRWVRTGDLPSPSEDFPHLPALTRDVIVHEGAGSRWFEKSVWFTPLAGGDPHQLRDANFYRAPQVCRDNERVWWVRDDQKLHIASAQANGAAVVCEPLPGKVVQAACVEGDLVAAATWGLVALFRIAEGGRLRPLAHLPVDGGDVSWVGVAGAWLAAIVDRRSGLWGNRSSHSELHVWQRGEGATRSHQVVRLRRSVDGVASMSRDGRKVAVAQGLEVHLIELEGGRPVSLAGPQGNIVLVRFTDEDRILVIADSANRVILRPRSAAGDYAGELVEASIPSEPVPLAIQSPAPRPP